MGLCIRDTNRANGAMPFGIPRSRRLAGGFTLVEVVAVIAILAIIGWMAVTQYGKYMDRARNTQAATDVRAIDAAITKFYVEHSSYPTTLAEANIAMTDPWGNPYVYRDFSSLKNDNLKRKDRNVQPINSDYDLYSRGKDKGTKLPIDRDVGADDIVRGRNGRYIGLGKEYH